MESAAPNDEPSDASEAPIELAQARGPGAVQASAGGAGSSDLALAITSLRDRIDEEFSIAERLDSKARQAFALAAVFFAAVQTVTFGSFAQAQISSEERPWLLVFAIVAGVFVATVGYRLANGEDLLEEADIKPEAIVKWCNDATDSDYVAVKLVAELSRMARRRSDNNAIRSRNYDAVTKVMRISLSMTAVELIVAIVVRL